MNWDQIAGKWKQLKGSIQMKWGDLTNDDIDEIRGRNEILLGKIQERYGKTKEEAQQDIDDWVASLKD